jgi:nitrogen-specific signal transduction histidine kinase
MASSDDDLRQELQNLKADIRTVIHDIGNPLGVIRMTAFYLQKGVVEKDRQVEYLTMITDNIEKIAAGLNVLRDLSDDSPLGAPPLKDGTGEGGAL